jgi:hypothetical protein
MSIFIIKIHFKNIKILTSAAAAGPLLSTTPPRELLVRTDRVDPTEAVLTRGSPLVTSPSDFVA